MRLHGTVYGWPNLSELYSDGGNVVAERCHDCNWWYPKTCMQFFRVSKPDVSPAVVIKLCPDCYRFRRIDG